MQIRIAHIYPELLNQYGDAGNIITLKHRLEKRGFECVVKSYMPGDCISFDDTDIVYLGGGTEKATLASYNALLSQKDELTKYVENGGVLLAVCSGYEMLGKSFECAGQRLDGFAITNSVSRNAKTRLIGDIVTENKELGFEIVGFENHLGRTDIGKHTPLGVVRYGFGNNDSKKTEGLVYKNVIGTYIHGPLLPKNPKLADYIISCVLKQKSVSSTLGEIDDTLENKAHDYILKKYC